ncbi:hypothetical protein [Pyrobaculum sp.]|uniref:hypothetical protein n=1 Tax=Pyrobaculum sp. TaxID=2004705 RepID=UPI00316EA8AB
MQKFKRKLKGVEPIVAAVILIVIAVAGGVILYLVLTGAIGSTPVPKLQLDVYNSKIMGTTAFVVVNAGEDVTAIINATLYDATNPSSSARCDPQRNAPFRAGSVITFVCRNIPASSKYVFELVYTSGATRKVFRADWIRS